MLDLVPALSYSPSQGEEKVITEDWALENWSNQSQEYTHTFTCFDDSSENDPNPELERILAEFDLQLPRGDDSTLNISINPTIIKDGYSAALKFSVFNFKRRIGTFHSHGVTFFTKNSHGIEDKIPILQSQITEENSTIQNNSARILIKCKISKMSPLPRSIPQSLMRHTTLPQKIFQQYTPIIVDESPSFSPAPYSGLRNQGATCYMNSVLQSLFHIPAFRRLIYSIEADSSSHHSTRVVKSLQRLFASLQLSHTACSTSDLTQSFGWGTAETIVQHDVQEFTRVLIDHIENCLRGSKRENEIASLFRGQMKSVLRCQAINFLKETSEFFYDLSIVVKSCSSLVESLKKFTEKEVLSGENQCDIEGYGKQDAEIGYEFVGFPKILQLHLRRFEFDHNRMEKVLTYFSFPEELDLGEFLNGKQKYSLHGVLVHYGMSSGGHYYAFLRPSIENRWFKFNDSNVTEVSKEEAIEANFGGYEKPYSSYMLIYVREDEENELFRCVNDEEIPKEIVAELQEQKQMDEEIEIKVYTDSNLKGNAEKGILDIGDESFRIRIRKEETYEDLSKKIEERHGKYQLYQIDLKKEIKVTKDTVVETKFFAIPNNETAKDPFLLYVYDPAMKTPLNYKGLRYSDGLSLSEVASGLVGYDYKWYLVEGGELKEAEQFGEGLPTLILQAKEGGESQVTSIEGGGPETYFSFKCKDEFPKSVAEFFSLRKDCISVKFIQIPYQTSKELKFPRLIAREDLEKFICFSFGIRLNEDEEIRLFWGNDLERSIIVKSYKHSCAFATALITENLEPRRVIKVFGIRCGEYKKVAKIHLFIRNGTTVGELFDMEQIKKFGPNLRILVMDEEMVIVTERDKELPYRKIFLDSTPEDQIVVKEGEKIIEIAKSNSAFEKVIRIPFKAIRGEKFKDTMKRIQPIVGTSFAGTFYVDEYSGISRKYLNENDYFWGSSDECPKVLKVNSNRSKAASEPSLKIKAE